MKDITSANFGLLIAYLLPGFAALWGILTGERNGIVVIDFDDGVESARRFYRELCKKFTGTPKVAIARTPRPGIHMVMGHPGEPVKNAVKAMIMDVVADVRADGGYIVADPSVTCGRYEWVKGFELSTKKLDVFDPAWLAVEREQPITRGKIRSLDSYLAKIESYEGQGGSKGLVRAAAVCRDCGLSEAETTIKLVAWNRGPTVSPPWSDEELARAIHRVYQRGGV
jgi:hypothetical protein